MLRYFFNSALKEEGPQPEVGRFVANGLQSEDGEIRFNSQPLRFCNEFENMMFQNNRIGNGEGLEIPESQMRLAIEPFQGSDESAQMGVSNPSNLRLRAQYLFNVFEEVGNDEDDKELKVMRYTNETVLSKVRENNGSNEVNQFKFTSFVKILAAAVLAFFVCLFCLSFHNDVVYHSGLQLLKKQVKREECISQYEANDCENPVIYLTSKCNEWKLCIASEGNYVEKTPIIAQLISQLFNNLFTFIHTKELIYILMIFSVIGTIALGAFNAYLNRPKARY